LLPHHSLGWRACKITEHDEEKGTYGVEFKNGELKNGVIMGLLREPLGKVLIGRKPLVFDVGDSKIDGKVRLDEERQSLATKTTHTRTSAQPSPPP